MDTPSHDPVAFEFRAAYRAAAPGGRRLADPVRRAYREVKTPSSPSMREIAGLPALAPGSDRQLPVSQVQLMTAPIFLRALWPALPRSTHGSVTIVRLRGELDVLDASALQACLGDIRWPGRPRSIIDLTGLDYIDCACLSVLARHACDVRAQGGTVELAGPHGAVRRILSVTGLLTGLEVHDTGSQAACGRGRRTMIFPPARERAPAARRTLSLGRMSVPGTAGRLPAEDLADVLVTAGLALPVRFAGYHPADIRHGPRRRKSRTSPTASAADDHCLNADTSGQTSPPRR